MFKKFRALSLFATVLFFATAHAQTADDIVAKHIKATGGIEKLKSVKTMKITGSSSIPAMGMQATFTRRTMRPDLLRMDINVQGQDMVQAYDGEKAWQIVPFSGSTAPQAMPESEAKYFRMQADMDGPLVDYKKKGHSIELVGKEMVDEKEAYNLKVTMKGGDVVHLYIDSESYLQVKSKSVTPGPGGNPIEVEATFGDYKTIEGMAMAHTITQQNPMQGTVEIKMTGVEVNPEIDKSIFAMPKE